MGTNKILLLLIAACFILSDFIIKPQNNFAVHLVLSIAILILSVLIALSKKSKLSRSGLFIMLAVAAAFLLIPFLFK